jgi:hypothetical protein
MVQALQALIGIYKERLMGIPTAPSPSFGRPAFGVDGAVNRLFLMHLFLDFDIAIQFLKDTGLIRSQMTCYTCGLDMTWSAISQRLDQFRWRCVGVVLPCALRLDLSSTDRGFTIGVSRFRRFCS